MAVSGFAEKSQNIAKPEVDPYVDPAGSRASHEPIADFKVNEARVYDFYQRQADYYMAMSPEELPKILPAFPGLDAGKFGHWGKHNENNKVDGRWNNIDHGPLVTQVWRHGDNVVLKGMSIDLGEGLSTVFDPQHLCYPSVWEGGFVKFKPFRWGSARNASPAGKVWFSDNAKKGWAGSDDGNYHGHYRSGRGIWLNYTIGETEILESASAMEDSGGKGFVRWIGFPKGTSGVKLRVGKELKDAHCWVFQFEFDKKNGGAASIVKDEDGTYWLDSGPMREKSYLLVNYWRGPEEKSKEAEKSFGWGPGWLSARTALEDVMRRHAEGSKGVFGELIKVASKLGEQVTTESPYVVDTIGIPFDNPYKSVMQLTGIAFNPDGTALVTVLAGDVWKVSGIDESLENVTWKRFATGFNQPIGIHIDEDGIFVLDRGRITRLHDYNGDDEADFYENYASDFGGYDRSHTHTFGLHRMADGSFTFTQRESILRTGTDQKTREVAWGVRNCMGIGGSDTFAWVAPQEGIWTPASMIIEVKEGEFYGLPKKGQKKTNIAAPLCYIPRGIDNSTGGMIEAKSDRWGALSGHQIGISYGYGSHYLILRDRSGARAQGATVPLEGGLSRRGDAWGFQSKGWAVVCRRARRLGRLFDTGWLFSPGEIDRKTISRPGRV